MCRILRHRGPDDTGYYLDDRVGLGVDRLKIIDLKTGNQPIHNENQSIWIVFNGEIYNYQELRKELESRGHDFYTESDTESVVHAYEEWHDDCVSHLRGMFAFAIWDSERRRLYLARDRFGKKPLYYALVNGVFLFGSELKAILMYDEFDRKLSFEAMDYFFTYMYIPSPLTIFQGINKLPPGHYCVYEDGELTVRQYWDMKLQANMNLNEDTFIDLLYDRILESVKIRLRSDVPLGAFLSGGIDSSTVVSLMSKLSESPVKTVSIGFDHSLSEVRYSRRVAEYLGTDHHEYIVTPEAYKILPKLVWHFDEPFADHSMIPTYYLSEVTRREVTVALSGDGGDELFMGYPFLSEPPIFSLYSKVPSPIRKITLKTIINLPLNTSFKRMADHAYQKNYGNQSSAERYAMRVSLVDNSGLRKLYSKSLLASHTPIDSYDYMRRLVESGKGYDALSSVDYATIRSYLEEDILVKVDRMSMAASLEVRCPLLDQGLAALVEQIPTKLKMNGRTTKYIFKKMVIKKNLIPPEIATRKKQGFGAPVESWMQNEWKDVAGQLLDPQLPRATTGYFDRETVRKLLREPYLNSNKLFALVVFVLWHRMYLEQHKTMEPPQNISAMM